MKKHLIVSGLIFILLMVGFSGCIELESNKPHELSIIGRWHLLNFVSRPIKERFYDFYNNGTARYIVYRENPNGTITEDGSGLFFYEYSNNVMSTDDVFTTYWNIEWLNNNIIIKTPRNFGSTGVYERVDSLEESYERSKNIIGIWHMVSQYSREYYTIYNENNTWYGKMYDWNTGFLYNWYNGTYQYGNNILFEIEIGFEKDYYHYKIYDIEWINNDKIIITRRTEAEIPSETWNRVDTIPDYN